MQFHEKSLELNITHELLNLTDAWYWFLMDIPLWRYWRPRYKLPFLNMPRSTAGGLHSSIEGKHDPIGDSGGGYDVRIKTGIGNHLLFIQYKRGEYVRKSPGQNSIFNKKPIEHYKFKFNSTRTNQHFTLRALSKGIGSKKGNAVVYAFPLISSMDELERNAGKLLRKTEFISINDIDKQAICHDVEIIKNQEHNFRICKRDMDRCEVNYYYFYYSGPERTFDIIADTIALGFQKNLVNYIDQVEDQIENYSLNSRYIKIGMKRAFGQYLRYLLHYFEIKPDENEKTFNLFYEFNERNQIKKEFENYKTSKRGLIIINSVFKSLNTFADYIRNPLIEIKKKMLVNKEIPTYKPSIYIENPTEGLSVNFQKEIDLDNIQEINSLTI